MRIAHSARVTVAVALLLALPAGCAIRRDSVAASRAGAAPSVTTPAPTPTAQPGPPGAGTWSMLPAARLQAGYFTGVWTGTELFIHRPNYDTEGQTPTGSVDAAYNPATNTWRRLPSAPYPVFLMEGGYRAFWTGTEVLAFGMLDAAFNPATNTWRKLPAGPGGPSATVWTGQEVLAWGGGCCASNTATGSAFNVARNVWEPMAASPLAPRHAPGVWTGTEMFVIGGQADNPGFVDGAAYNPATRTWRMIAPMPATAVGATMTWTGSEILVVGGVRSTDTSLTVLAQGLAYNPATNTWRHLPDMPMARTQHMAVWAGSQLLVWGGITRYATGSSIISTAPANGVAYDPATNRWYDMPRAPLRGRTQAIVAWTGSQLLVWGGTGAAQPESYADGAAFTPQRSPLP